MFNDHFAPKAPKALSPHVVLVEERGIVHFEVLEDGAEKGLAHPAAAVGDVILGEVAVNELLLLFREKGDEPLGTGGVLRLKSCARGFFLVFFFIV